MNEIDESFNRQTDGSGVRPLRDSGFRAGDRVTTFELAPSEKLTYLDAATAQKVVTIVKAAEQGLTVALAYDAAFRVRERKYAKPKPKPIPIPIPADGTMTPQPQPVVTTHNELQHTFSDGETWVACTATDCLFGKTRKRHSDAVQSVDVESVESDEPLDEVTDDVAELSTENWLSGADVEDEDELSDDDKVEDEHTLEVEQDVEISEKADQEVIVECQS